MPGWPLGVAAVIALAPLALYFVVRGRAGLAATAAVSLATPFLVPPDQPLLRFFIGMGALVHIAKAIEFVRGRARDPAMLRSLPRFLLWHVVPPDSTWPIGAGAAAAARRAGRRRLLRAAAKLPLVVGLLALCNRVPWIESHVFSWASWNLLFSYLWMSAGMDLYTGLAMQTGIDVAEVFRAPPLARSPADFWNRRWNVFFCTWARRNVFLPLGGRRRPAVALLAAFAVSAIAHEYLVAISLGRTRGEMTAFFMLQGLATLASLELTRLRRPRPPLPAAVAVALHAGWLTLTAPLFYGPIVKIFAAAASGLE